jgi:hypothetical protein
VYVKHEASDGSAECTAPRMCPSGGPGAVQSTLLPGVCRHPPPQLL